MLEDYKSHCKTTTKIKTTTNYELTSEDLVKILQLPEDSTVKFTVPRGGDYSGMSLEISRDFPLTIITNEANG